jgi:hypothetical protein
MSFACFVILMRALLFHGAAYALGEIIKEGDE